MTCSSEAPYTPFYAARGDTIVVQSTGALVVKDASGAVLLSKTAAEAAQRKLLGRGGGRSSDDSFEFSPTIMMDTEEETYETSEPQSVDCGNTPLVTTQTGTFSNCLDSDNLHYWPANYEAGDCHGWRGTDSVGHVHDNSANNIQCTENGITYDQYAGNLVRFTTPPHIQNKHLLKLPTLRLFSILLYLNHQFFNPSLSFFSSSTIPPLHLRASRIAAAAPCPNPSSSTSATWAFPRTFTTKRGTSLVASIHQALSVQV